MQSTMADASARDSFARYHGVCLLCVIALAAGLRFYRLDSAPPPLFQDEAVHAYDAWCIRTTGMDHHGVHWPIFFRAFGDFHPGLFIYLLVPVQALFGMTVWSTRCLPAAMGTLAVLLVYLLARRWYGPRVGLIAALLLAVSPWHVHLSRLGFEASMCPALVTLAVLLLARGQDSPSLARLALSGLFFGLACWVYHAMRVFVPALLVGIAILYGRRLLEMARRHDDRPGVVGLACGFALGLAPFLWAWIQTPGEAWARASSQLILKSQPNPGLAAAAVVRNYLEHFSPSFLFF